MPSFLKDSFARYRTIDRFFSSNILNLLSHSLLAWKISFGKSASYGSSLKCNVLLSHAALKSLFCRWLLQLFGSLCWYLVSFGPHESKCPFLSLFFSKYCFLWASLVAEMVKNLPAVWETWVWSLGWEDPLEEGMVTHFGVVAWRTPWTEEPGGLQSVGLQTAGLDWAPEHSTRCFYVFPAPASSWGARDTGAALPPHPPGAPATQVLFLLMVSCHSHRLSSALFLWWDNFKCPVIASLYCMVNSDFKALYWIFRAQSLYSLDRGLLYGLFLMVPIFCWSHFVIAVFPPWFH